MLNSEKTGWTKLKLKMPYSAHGHGTVVLNGEIYVFGGCTDEGKTDKCYKLNKEMKWEKLRSMMVKREIIGNSSVVLNGTIWVIGGRQTKSVERYDPGRNCWDNMP